VRINLSGLKDETVKAGLRQKMETVVRESEAQYQDALELVEKKLAG
jgi:formiminotetrahydrofolate cyclodeaminase